MKALGGGKDPVKEDPFLKYGTGIQSYFSFQVDLIRLFVMLSLLSIPSLIIYSNSRGLTEISDNVTTLEKLSFANIGFADTVCSRFPFMQDS